MRQTSRASRASDASSLNARGPRRTFSGLGVAFALALTLGACRQQNGVVGSEPLAAAPDSGAPDSGTKTPTFRTDFDANGGDWQPGNALPGSSTNFGVPTTGAADPSTAELRFPGHPEYSATTNAGSNHLTEIDSSQQFSFGTYRTRVQFGSCDPSEDAVNATLGYFNDGTDADQNGLTDDLEITLQALCGTPHRLYLTVFTDNDPASGQFRKLAHVVDFMTGDLYDTPSAQKSDFTKTGTNPAFVRPELFDPNAFYEIGFEWHSSLLRFFLVIDGTEQTVWTLTDATHIPQRPVSFVYNLWHPATHWYPATGAAAFPANDVVMHVDWFEYYAE
jgi:hypothetical protein